MHRLFSAKVVLFFSFLLMLDGTILPVLKVGSVYPSFLCLFICYSAFEWGAQRTIYVAFWAGLFRDFLGGGFIGLEACLFVGVAVGLNFLVQKLEREFPGMYFLITFLFIFVTGFLRLLMEYVADLPGSLFWNYTGLIALSAVYSGLFLPVFYFLADRWFGQSHVKQYELFR